MAGIVLSVPAMAEDEIGERDPVSTVLFGSLEAGPTKTFTALGMKRSYGEGGLDASGFRTLVKVGLAREQAGRVTPRGIAYKSEAQALIGYEWRIGDTFVAVYAGTDYESEQRPCGCVVSRFGQRLQGDLWATPLPEMMLQASAYASTIERRLWGRLATGWTFPPDLLPQGYLPESVSLRGVYVGPEIESYRQNDYSKLRLGLHLTGLRLFGLTWRLSGGWQRTSDRPSEAYATLGLHWRK